MAESKFKTHFPDVHREVLDLIPHTDGKYLLACIRMVDSTYFEVSAGSHNNRGPFFWIPDIDAMLLKLAKYEDNIHFHRPGAQQALEDFKDQQNKIVVSIHEVSFISP